MVSDRKNNRTMIGFMFLFAAVAIIVGLSVSFFSDIIRGTGTATAGTLDITGTVQIHQNGVLISDGTIPNLNPGDIIVVKTAISNTGNKSAYLRSVVNAVLPDTDAMPNLNMIKVYAGEYDTIAEVEAETSLTFTGGVYESSRVIINGTGGADAETENDGIATYSPVYTIYFDKAATNEYQGKKVDFSLTIQAIQYRNNPNPVWDDVVSSSFGS